MSDKMRKEFEKWATQNPVLKSYMWEAWQAATAQSEQRIKELEMKLAEQQAAVHAKNAALSRWTIGTCVCKTKTSEPSHHALNCPYRIACDGIDIQPSTQELTRLLQAAKVEALRELIVRYSFFHHEGGNWLRISIEKDIYELERGKKG